MSSQRELLRRNPDLISNYEIKGKEAREKYEEVVKSNKNEIIEELSEAFEKIKNYSTDNFYKNSLHVSEEIDYELSDLRDLSWLEEYKDIERFELKAGLFVSALINKKIKPKDEVEIDLDDLKLSQIGFKLPCGKLTINGNAGDRVGYRAEEESEIYIKGDVGNEVGVLGEGKIEVEGKAGDEVGAHAEKESEIKIKGNVGNGLGLDGKGKIEVEGNAGDVVGMDAREGSVIEVKGKVNSLSNYCNGRVYWNYDQNIGNYRYKLENGKKYKLKKGIFDRKGKWRRKII